MIDDTPMDPLTRAKFEALDGYTDDELEALYFAPIDILIDCQHKRWSGSIRSVTITPLNGAGDPALDTDGNLYGFEVEMVAKDGRVATAIRDLEGCDTLLCRVKEQWLATVACLEELFPWESSG